MFRYLLFPFAFLYGLIIWVRNFLYDHKIMKSVEFDFPVISVGNLSYGGTGKTPQIEYLVNLLSPKYQVAILSRGYGRKTTGYLIAGAGKTAEEIGDEPLQMKLKYPQAIVCVAEDRVLAIPQLLIEYPAIQVILMDDAMQHRAVSPGMSIALTAYGNLFTRDYILPVGTLREPRSAYKRADFIIVSKCPPGISKEERAAIVKEINPGKNQAVFFSYLEYSHPYSIMDSSKKALTNSMDVLLFSGLATPKYLEEYVKGKVGNLYSRNFSDHHNFDRYDIENLTTAFNNITSAEKILLTTEKDAVKLIPFKEWIVEKRLPIYILPVKTDFFVEDKSLFDTEVLGYMEKLQKNG